jgi:HAD superfamily hydrolase (TIGR01490 family)
MESTFLPNSIPDKNYTAFFDLDRTIVKSVSGNSQVRRAFKKGLMTRSDLAKAVYLSVIYKLNLRNPQKIIDEMAGWARGLPEKTMDDLCLEVVNEELLPSIYSEAILEIKAHKDKNAKLVILSSALTPICREMSLHLEMDGFLCSDLEVKNGYLTGHPVGHLCFGEEKRVRLLEYCEKNNTRSSDAWYYGDSISDLPALSSVGNPVCVNPDKRLKKEGSARGWKILWWNS